MANAKLLMKKMHADYIWDGIGLSLIGIFSACYLVFNRKLAELHIQFPFLNFPLFIGEILIFLCLILFLIKFKNRPKKFTNWHLLFFLYFAFILAKAFCGYFKWGPLAFRHAALFYYPVFAVFGFAFYKRSLLNKYTILILSLLLIYIARFANATLTCFILACVLIKAYPKSNVIRNSLLFLLLIFTPYKTFFLNSRTALVSSSLTIIFIIFSLFFILRINKKFKILILALCLLCLTVILKKTIPANFIKSTVNINNLISDYKELDKEIREKERSFKMRKIQIALYNPGRRKAAKESSNEELRIAMKQLREKSEEVVVLLEKPEIEIKHVQIQKKKLPTMKKELKTNKEELKTMVEELREKSRELTIMIEKSQSPTHDLLIEIQSTIERSREIIKPWVQLTTDTEISQKIGEIQILIENLHSKIEIMKTSAAAITTAPPIDIIARGKTTSLFRIFIWRDMLMQIVKEKPLLGLDFGIPLRSKSIEILVLADGDWGACGWIEPHNSYLNIIYRAGLIGIVTIIVIFIFILKMIKKSLYLKSVTGILLCAALIDWLIQANFFVIFELPYSAIPFWSLFGMVFAYIKTLNKSI